LRGVCSLRGDSTTASSKKEKTYRGDHQNTVGSGFKTKMAKHGMFMQFIEDVDIGVGSGFCLMGDVLGVVTEDILGISMDSCGSWWIYRHLIEFANGYRLLMVEPPEEKTVFGDHPTSPHLLVPKPVETCSSS
jgi:hypothetical protein